MAEANQQTPKTAVGVGQDEEPGFNLAPVDFEGAYRVAQAFAKSTLVPKVYQGKPEDILVAWQYGGELGLGKMQSLQSIAIINGKPALPGETLLALALRSHELENHEEVWNEQTKTATVTVKRKGRPAITHSFSWADAERITTYEHGNKVTLASKDTYRNYPRRMCTMRARGFAFKDSFADLYKGFKTKEELEEVHDDDNETTRGPAMPREKVVNKPDDDVENLLKELDAGRGFDNTDGSGRPELPVESVSDHPTGAAASELVETNQDKPKQTAKSEVTAATLLEQLKAATLETWETVKTHVNGQVKLLKSNEDKLVVTRESNRINQGFNK